VVIWQHLSDLQARVSQFSSRFGTTVTSDLLGADHVLRYGVMAVIVGAHLSHLPEWHVFVCARSACCWLGVGPAAAVVFHLV
jgi:hypothetical protein